MRRFILVGLALAFVGAIAVSRAFTDPDRAAARLERGRYLVEHVSLCIDCHTPRNSLGIPQPSLYLAGTKKKPPLNVEIPNNECIHWSTLIASFTGNASKRVSFSRQTFRLGLSP